MTINLADHVRDRLVYVMTDLPPYSKLSEHRIKTKQDLKKRFATEMARLRWRHEQLQGNFNDAYILSLADELGWKEESLNIIANPSGHPPTQF